VITEQEAREAASRVCEMVEDRDAGEVGANTCAAGNAAGHGVSPGTRFVAELEFVMPVLHPGDYAMSIALADGTQEEHVQQHWIHDALAFTSAPSEWCFGLIAVEVMRTQICEIEAQDAQHERLHDSIAL